MLRESEDEDEKIQVTNEKIRDTLKGIIEKECKVSWVPATFGKVLDDIKERFGQSDVEDEIRYIKSKALDSYQRNEGFSIKDNLGRDLIIDLEVAIFAIHIAIIEKGAEHICRDIVTKDIPDMGERITEKMGHVYLGAAVIIDD